jgi:taurine transport system permease protein
VSEIVSNEALKSTGVLSAEGAPVPRVASSHVAPSSGKKNSRKPAFLLMVSTLSVLSVLALWYFSTERGWVSPVFLPKPGRVISEGAANLANGQLLKDIWMSTQRVVLGFALAGAVAIPLGIIMAVWAPAKAAVDPFVSLLRPLPSITWIPLTMLWLGIGEGQKIAIVFMGSWIYILLYTIESTKRVDPLLIRAARNLGAGDLDVMLHVILPGALPGIIAGLKVTLAISWSCVLSAEMIAAQNGLGALIWQGKDWGNLALVLVGMLCISIVVLLADKVANVLERLLLPWERHTRS